LAERILPVTDGAGIGLVINDHLSVACECGAAFCHLGQEDFFDNGHTHVSELAIPDRGGADKRPRVAVGLSTHSPEQARRALAAAPAYIAIGPVYATGTKPTAVPVTLDYVRWAAVNVPIPWFAIGGINLSNLEDVLAAGARRVCVVSAILTAPDIAGACQAFKQRLGSRLSGGAKTNDC
jgi:thiamine-phosphate pyrophosphorylase